MRHFQHGKAARTGGEHFADVRGAGHDQRMPRISSFYGIVIWMYHDEAHHLGRPHFHAPYGDDERSIDIEDLAVIAGRLPTRAQARRRVGKCTAD